MNKGRIIFIIILLIYISSGIEVKGDDISRKEFSIDKKDVREVLKESTLKLTGTVVGEGIDSYAIIEDEGSGKKGVYKVGDKIYGIGRIVKIMRDGILIEAYGIKRIFKITKGSNISIKGEDSASSNKGAVDISSFEPYESETGPLYEGEEKELPPFEPYENETGPPYEGEEKELPYFEPYKSETGPPYKGEVKTLP
jgi:hypothetical protein